MILVIGIRLLLILVINQIMLYIINRYLHIHSMVSLFLFFGGFTFINLLLYIFILLSKIMMIQRIAIKEYKASHFNVNIDIT